MPIEFNCSQCGQPFKVPERLAQTRCKCNRCGLIVTVPEPVSADDLVPVDDSDLLQPIDAPVTPMARSMPSNSAMMQNTMSGSMGPVYLPQNAYGGSADNIFSPSHPLWRSPIALVGLGAAGVLVVLGLGMVGYKMFFGRSSANSPEAQIADRSRMPNPSPSPPPFSASETAANPPPSTKNRNDGFLPSTSSGGSTPSSPANRSSSGNSNSQRANNSNTTDADEFLPSSMSSRVKAAREKALADIERSKKEMNEKFGSSSPSNSDASKSSASSGSAGGSATTNPSSSSGSGTSDTGSSTTSASSSSSKRKKKSGSDSESSSSSTASNDSAGSGSGEKELAPWKALPDPPPTTVESKPVRISIPIKDFRSVLFPRVCSNFVMVKQQARGKADNLRVFDLRTGSPIGQLVTETPEMSNEFFTADGRYLFGFSGSKRDARSIVGISFATGAEIDEVPIMKPHTMPTLHHAGPHRLLLSEVIQEKSLALSIYDVSSKSQVFSMTIAVRKNDRNASMRNCVAVSPGGKYAVLINHDVLMVVDLASGATVGESQLPDVIRNGMAFAFSPDGKELAFIAAESYQRRLCVWDFSTGVLKTDKRFELERYVSLSDGARLEWVAETALLLNRYLLLDPVTGEEVWTFPEENLESRRMLNLGQMLTPMKDAKNEALTTVQLPLKEIEKAVAAVRSGGSAVDANLPPLATANVLGSVPVSLPNGFVPWKVPAMEAVQAPKLTDREIGVTADNETLRAVYFAGASSGKAVIQKQMQRKAKAGRSEPPIHGVIRVDLTNGKKSEQIDLPVVYELIDVSSSGNFALVGFRQKNGNFDRLDVVGFSPKKHVVGWRPFSHEAELSTSQDADDASSGRWHIPSWKRRESRKPKEARWCVMVGDKQVLTVNGTGKLILWELPECRAVYTFADFGDPLAVSPDRQLLVGVHNNQFRIFSTQSGECVGDLVAPKYAATGLRGAFHSDGKRFAALVQGNQGLHIVVWNLSDGKPQIEFPVPGETLTSSTVFGMDSKFEGLEWRGERHLLLDGTYLFDTEQRSTVWRYYMQNSIYARGAADGQTWYGATKSDSRGGAAFLVSRPVPSPQIADKSQGVTFESQRVLGPGDRVRLTIQLSNAPPEAMQDATRRLTQALETRGIQIDDRANVTMSVTSEQRSTGTQIGVSQSPFGMPFSGGGGFSAVFDQQQLVFKMQLVDSQGVERWKSETIIRMRSSGLVRAQDSQAELQREMESSFKNLVSAGGYVESLPHVFFPALDAMLPGESQLKFAGESPPPPKQDTRRN